MEHVAIVSVILLDIKLNATWVGRLNIPGTIQWRSRWAGGGGGVLPPGTKYIWAPLLV